MASLCLPPDTTIITTVTTEQLTVREKQFFSVLVLPVNTSGIATQPVSYLLFFFLAAVLRTVHASLRRGRKDGRWSLCDPQTIYWQQLLQFHILAYPEHAVICVKFSEIPIKTMARTQCISEIIQENASECIALLIPLLCSKQSMLQGLLN